MSSEQTRVERISHEEAANIALKFINQHFNNPDRERPRASIPADPKRDDDLRLMAYIRQQKSDSDPAVVQRVVEAAREVCGVAPKYEIYNELRLALSALDQPAAKAGEAVHMAIDHKTPPISDFVMGPGQESEYPTPPAPALESEESVAERMDSYGLAFNVVASVGRPSDVDREGLFRCAFAKAVAADRAASDAEWQAKVDALKNVDEARGAAIDHHVARITELESKLAEQARELADAKAGNDYEAWTRERDDLRSKLAALESAKGEEPIEVKAFRLLRKTTVWDVLVKLVDCKVAALRESEVKG